ncbi:MAG: hypothetical protein ABJH52_00385 [Henriciella sp.]
MSWRLINWIWHIRGSLSLGPGLSSDEAFERLDPMFQQDGTTHKRADETLVFHKKDQAAQDKMSIFDGGVLSVEDGDPHPVLRYDLKSRALLACFIAPLIFLAFAQFSIILSGFDNGCAGGDRTSEQCAEETEEEEDVEDEVQKELHPIDKFLGAPPPKGSDEEDEAEDEEEEGEEEEEKMKHSPTRAYIFAGIFSVIYIVGRFLESWLIKRRFRKRLFPEDFAQAPDQTV